MQAAPDSRLSLMIVLVGLVGSMFGLLIGFCTAVIAPALDFISCDFGLGVLLQGVAVASVLLGGFVGAVSGIVLLLVAAAVPESPPWYLLKNRVADAERAHDPLPAQELGSGRIDNLSGADDALWPHQASANSYLTITAVALRNAVRLAATIGASERAIAAQ